MALRLIEGTPSRVVNVSSTVHQQGHINFDDLNWEKGYGAWRAYGASKLCNVLFSNEFNRRFSNKGIYSNSLHPGVIPTDLGRNNWTADLFYKVGNLFMKDIPQGAATTVYVATAPELEGVGGKYFADCNLANPSNISQSAEVALKLWTKSEKFVGINH